MFTANAINFVSGSFQELYNCFTGIFPIFLEVKAMIQPNARV
jgi:hypothetical protein